MRLAYNSEINKGEGDEKRDEGRKRKEPGRVRKEGWFSNRERMVYLPWWNVILSFQSNSRGPVLPPQTSPSACPLDLILSNPSDTFPYQ